MRSWIGAASFEAANRLEMGGQLISRLPRGGAPADLRHQSQACTRCFSLHPWLLLASNLTSGSETRDYKQMQALGKGAPSFPTGTTTRRRRQGAGALCWGHPVRRLTQAALSYCARPKQCQALQIDALLLTAGSSQPSGTPACSTHPARRQLWAGPSPSFTPRGLASWPRQ